MGILICFLNKDYVYCVCGIVLLNKSILTLFYFFGLHGVCLGQDLIVHAQSDCFFGVWWNIMQFWSSVLNVPSFEL